MANIHGQNRCSFVNPFHKFSWTFWRWIFVDTLNLFWWIFMDFFRGYPLNSMLCTKRACSFIRQVRVLIKNFRLWDDIVYGWPLFTKILNPFAICLICKQPKDLFFKQKHVLHLAILRLIKPNQESNQA